jgi:hypothetical protein
VDGDSVGIIIRQALRRYHYQFGRGTEQVHRH